VVRKVAIPVCVWLAMYWVAPVAVRADAGDDQYAVAAAHYSRQSWELAAQEFASFLRKYPDHPRSTRAYFYLGEALVQQQNFREARQYFVEFLRRDPGNQLARQATFRAAEAAFMQADANTAQRELTAFRERYPNDKLNGYVLPYLGDLAMAAGDLVRAERTYAQGIMDYPQGPLRDDCRFGHARALQLLGKSRSAIAEYELLASQGVSEVADAAQFQLGALWYTEQDYAEADRTLSTFETNFRNSRWQAKARVIRAKALTQLGRYQDSQQLLESVTSSKSVSNPEWQAHRLLTTGVNLVALEKYNAAVTSLEEFQQLRPAASDAAHGYANLTIAYAKLGQMDQARRRLAELVNLRPDATLLLPTLQNTADAAVVGGDKAWAAELYGQLSRQNNYPDYVKVGLAGLAKCQVQTANLSQAEATLDRMIQQYPDDARSAEAAILRGRLLEQENKLDAALGMYRLVIENFPKSNEVPQALLAAARLYDKLKQDEYAATMYERFVRDYPTAPEIDAAIYGWGWVLRDLNKPDKAEEQFTRLYREYPQSSYWADATFRLAEQAAAKRRYDTADQLLGTLLNKPQLDAGLRQHVLYVYGQNAVATEKWTQVGPRLSKLLTEYADSPLRMPAEYWIAEAEYRQGKYDRATELFNALSEKVRGRQDRWLALVSLRRAQLLAQERKWEAAAKLAATIEGDFPGFEQQYEVDYLIGRSYASLADFKSARESYQKVLRSRTGAKSETAAMAQWMIGESYFHQQQYEAALREYQSVGNLFAMEYPRWQAAALLQAGKCQEQLQRIQEAGDSYGRLLQAYGNSEFANEAKQRLSGLQTKASQQARK